MATNDAEQPQNPTETEQPDESRFGLEFGVESNLPFSTPYQPMQDGTGKTVDEELREVYRDESIEWGPTVRQLVAMRRMDGQARALYRLLTLPIRSALTHATFVPAEGDKGEAEFITQAMNLPPESGGMTVTFHRFMSQMLMGLFDGFAAFEKSYWKPEFGPLKGKITLMKLGYRPPETVTFVTDKKGGFRGIRQRAYNGGTTTDVFIDRDYVFYFAAQEEERKYYGISFFQSAFYHYDKKVKLYFNAHLAAQRAAVGTRVGTHPTNAPAGQRKNFAQALSSLSLAQWMMQPDGYKVEILKEGGGFDFLAQINHHNSQMSKSLLAAFFDESQGTSAAEGPLVNFAKPGDEMFTMMLRAVMDDIANQINHYIIPQLIDFNFDGGKYPKFSWGTLTEEQKAAISATFNVLMTSKSDNITPEFVRAVEETQAKEYGLEIDYEAIEEREAEQAASGIDPATGQPIQPAGAPGAPGAATGPNGEPLTGAAATTVAAGGTPPKGATQAGMTANPQPGGGAATGNQTVAATADVDPEIAAFEQQALRLANPSRSVLDLAADLLDAAYEELD